MDAYNLYHHELLRYEHLPRIKYIDSNTIMIQIQRHKELGLY